MTMVHDGITLCPVIVLLFKPKLAMQCKHPKLSERAAQFKRILSMIIIGQLNIQVFTGGKNDMQIL